MDDKPTIYIKIDIEVKARVQRTFVLDHVLNVGELEHLTADAIFDAERSGNESQSRLHLSIIKEPVAICADPPLKY